MIRSLKQGLTTSWMPSENKFNPLINIKLILQNTTTLEIYSDIVFLVCKGTKTTNPMF